MPRIPTPTIPRWLPTPGFGPAARVTAGFRATVSGDPSGTPDWVRALEQGDDEGYFGPGSAVWAVHSDLATLVGGIRALLLQATHPVVLAGVDTHSTYRHDPAGRLAGTARWLTVTAFGSRAAARREAARVRGLHRRVRGTYRAGGPAVPYRADEQRLLEWVHVAFTDSFLTTHELFAGPIPGGPDAYVREWAVAGELVGLADPPRDRAALERRIAGFADVLGPSPATGPTVAFLREPPFSAPAARAGYPVLFAAAVSTLRPEHRRVLGLADPGRRVPQAAAAGLLAGLRTALPSGPPAAGAARRRLERVQRVAS